MFEQGKHYRIETLEGSDRVFTRVRVDEVQLPLIKVSCEGRAWTINTGSSAFVGAEEVSSEPPEPFVIKVSFEDEDEDDAKDREQEERDRNAGRNPSTGY